MPPSLVTEYHVGTGAITLVVTVRDGQLGGTVVRLGVKELALGDVKRVRLGTGATLVGKVLFVKSVVTDAQHKGKPTSVRYELKGGAEDRVFDLDASVKAKGGSATYRATFYLKA